jgi:hypothetical protein
MKSQLKDWKQGRKRNFGFTSILYIFLFEQVPILIPRFEIVPHRPCDPTMSRWTEVIRRLGGGRVPTPYNDEFFFWWHRQVIGLDGYPYEGINYRGDPDMPLPPSSTYGDIGKYIFIYLIFLCFSKRIKNENVFV